MRLEDHKFLIVDDHLMIRQMIATTLKAFGVTSIDMAADGVLGLEKIKQSYESGAPYDVLLLDWSMPNMNGYDLLCALRADRQFDKLAIIMLTAESEDINIVKALDAGAAAYVTKPFKPQVLEKKINDVVTWRQKEMATA